MFEFYLKTSILVEYRVYSFVKYLFLDLNL